MSIENFFMLFGVFVAACLFEILHGGEHNDTIRAVLRRIADRCPARVIYTGDKPYLWRYFLGEWRRFGVTFYLHEFATPDAERWLHNHPFRASLGVVLTGGYLEERLQYLEPAGPHVRLNKVRMLNWISERDFHRITLPAPGTWTLFICMRRVHEWGFLEAPQGTVHVVERGKKRTFEPSHAIVFHNPFIEGERKGGDRWWIGAPTGRELRAQYARGTARTRYGESVKQ